jgi:regulatory protein
VTVTDLREHPRKPGRYLVRLASGAEVPVSVELIAELKLKVGRTLSDDELQRLEAGARALRCYDAAVATLGARARSVADLQRYLRTKDFTDAEIQPAADKLQALGLLDDLEYARTYARSRLAPSRGMGPRRVAMELARKGVARPIVDRVLSECADEREALQGEAAEGGEPPMSAAQQAAAKKLRSLAGLDPAVQRRRLHGFLARRGFSSGEIAEVLRGLRG